MSTTEEPPVAKKAKTEDNANGDSTHTGWEGHTMNISEAVMKADEGKHLIELAALGVEELQGIGPKATEVLEQLGTKTVRDLGQYKFFLMARSIATLAETETAGGRPAGSVLNIDKALDKEWESKSLKEIVAAPTSALQGLSDPAGALLESLGVKTVGDLARFKYCRWAEAIVGLVAYEEGKTTQERKEAAALKRLA